MILHIYVFLNQYQLTIKHIFIAVKIKSKTRTFSYPAFSIDDKMMHFKNQNLLKLQGYFPEIGHNTKFEYKTIIFHLILSSEILAVHN